MAAKTKKTRKELLKQDDAFLAAANQSAQWVKQNRTMVIAGSVASIVLIGGIWGGTEFVRTRNISASADLQAALRIKNAEVITETEDTKADPTAEPPTYASKEARDKAALESLQAVAAQGGGVGDMAALYVAGLHEDLGNKEQAEKDFAALASSLSSRDNLLFIAVERLAYLQEARGDHDGAIATLNQLTRTDDGFYRDYAAFHRARLYLKKGDKDRARELFERLEKDFPDSTIREDVKNHLAMIGGGEEKDESEKDGGDETAENTKAGP